MPTLEEILDRWAKIKQQQKQLNAEDKEIRELLLNSMNSRNVEALSSTNYIVSRKKATRTSMTKASCPIEIWNQFAKTTRYDILSLKDKRSAKNIDLNEES